MRTLRTAILISGRGSNMEALVKAASKKDFPAEIVLVLSNRPDAEGLKFAKKAGIPTVVVDHTKFESRDAFEEAIDENLKTAKTELVCLAGFMRVLNATFVNRWRDRILNIHPSLLPSFRGLHTHERVLEAGVKITGCTVHFVRPEMDDGPIIIQATVPVNPEDTVITLAARVLEFEHKIYPKALKLVAEGKVKVAGGKASISSQKRVIKGITNPST
ncbi:MAG: phosphoribosylglycinamide formyltransferase [Sphingomonadales bacterium]